MVEQSLKTRKSSIRTEFIRQAIHSDRLQGILDIPDELKNRMVEVILLPLDHTEIPEGRKTQGSALERFAGAWAGELLVREEEGNYEVREKLK